MAKPTDLSVLCRLCLQESDQLDCIFGANENSSLVLRIMSCVSLEVHRTDNLPKGVCPACRYQLEKTYIFRSRCRNNDQRLKRHVKLLAAGKTSRLLDELEEDEDDEFLPSLDYIRCADEAEKQEKQKQWDAKVSALEVEFQAVADLQRATLYEEVRNELLSKKLDNLVDAGTMTWEEVEEVGESEQMEVLSAEESMPEPEPEMEPELEPEPQQEPEQFNIKIVDSYTIEQPENVDPKKKLRAKIHARLAKQDEELIQYLEEERMARVDEEDDAEHGENDMEEICDEERILPTVSSIGTDRYIITEVSDSETYVVDDLAHEESELYGSDEDSDEDLEAVTNAVKAELAERPNLNVDENCVMKVEKNRDLTKVEVRATDGSLICMEFSRMRKTPSPTPSSTYHVKFSGQEYVCPECPLTFKNSRQLEAHTCLTKEAKTYSCDVCNKVFSTRTALKRHYRTHTGEKPFTCLLCDRSFVQKEILKRHMLTHSDTRPHACDHCPKRFNQKDQLRHHVNRFHSENPVVIIHKCHLCNKTFKHASGLSRHTATHYGRTYPCSCGRTFNDKSALKRHEVAIHGPGTKKVHSKGPKGGE